MGKSAADFDRYYHPPFGTRLWTSTPRPNMQNEIEYKGLQIVQNDYHNLHDNVESFGFTVSQAYVVVDEMGDKALPTIQQWFWSPLDAMIAIDLSEYFKTQVPKKKWPTTVAHEFNQALAYRRRFGATYVALKDIEKACADAESMGDDAGPEVMKILETLKRVVNDQKSPLV